MTRPASLFAHVAPASQLGVMFCRRHVHDCALGGADAHAQGKGWHGAGHLLATQYSVAALQETLPHGRPRAGPASGPQLSLPSEAPSVTPASAGPPSGTPASASPPAEGPPFAPSETSSPHAADPQPSA
jgi:hypothetical protein